MEYIDELKELDPFTGQYKTIAVRDTNRQPETVIDGNDEDGGFEGMIYHNKKWYGIKHSVGDYYAE